jgi:hypothetical protein
MPAEPPDAGQARPPRALATEAGRERLIGMLRELYAHGLLDEPELSRRVGIVLAARFTDEAAVAVAGLPVLAAAVGDTGIAASRRPAAGDQRGRDAGGTGGRPRRGRYAESAGPGPGWVPTQERFRDPASGKIIRVWVDPANQARHYVPEPDGG